jgi:hypothetical protein
LPDGLPIISDILSADQINRLTVYVVTSYSDTKTADCRKNLGFYRSGLASRTAKKNPIYIFLFWELRGFSPNFHIHVSVSDFYILRIGPHISLQHNRQKDPGNI